MGARGPVGKRSDQRHGHRSAAEQARTVKAPAAPPPPVPVAEDDWHPLARDWFASLALSGQSVFYEPSDWQQARVVTSLLSKILLADKPSPEMVKAWQSGAADLLTTEGARRRVRVELQRPGVEEAVDVSELDDYRRRLNAG